MVDLSSICDSQTLSDRCTDPRRDSHCCRTAASLDLGQKRRQLRDHHWRQIIAAESPRHGSGFSSTPLANCSKGDHSTLALIPETEGSEDCSPSRPTFMAMTACLHGHGADCMTTHVACRRNAVRLWHRSTFNSSISYARKPFNGRSSTSACRCRRHSLSVMAASSAGQVTLAHPDGSTTLVEQVK